MGELSNLESFIEGLPKVECLCTPLATPPEKYCPQHGKLRDKEVEHEFM